MPDDVEKTARKQLDRLKQMAQSSAEYTVQRTYLEWLVELPWAKQTEDRLDLDKAREILDADHYDLKKVKKRILEYLAVRKLAPGKKGPILCLAGPPGVGKTSLGKSIARSLGREFVRMSLGGVRDEAEIRGHRRTYIGALPGPHHPGHAARGHQEPGVHARRDRQAGRRLPRRPVGGAARGARPRAELDLLGPLPGGALRPVERHLHRHGEHARSRSRPPCSTAWRCWRSPATPSEEKLHIAQRHLVPKQIAEHGLTDEQIELPRRRARRRSSSSTRARPACATSSARWRTSSAPSRSRSPRAQPYEPTLTARPRRRRSSGPQKYYSEAAERTEIPGVATGLAWTPDGRRHPLHRGVADAGQGQPDPHRAARRRHEGVGARGAVLGAHARGGPGHHRRLRQDGHPRARPGGRRCRRTGRRRASP